MPRVLHFKSPQTGGIRVFLATPAYAGLSAAYTYALFASQQALFEAGINADFEIMAENCHVDDSRNILVRDFLETDCEMLVFLDADLRWRPSELVRLIQHKADIVAGIYPLKESDERYPVRMLDGDIQAESNGLVEVEAVPTGFLKISRDVLETLADEAPGFMGKTDTAKRRKIPLIFERTMENGTRWGGDYTFCRKAAIAGFPIYIDPEMTFEHSGDWQFNGCYGDYLRKANGILPESFIEALNSLRNGNPSEEDFLTLYRHWGNPAWSAGPDLLMSAYYLAKQHKTALDCGSGLTTLVMAAAGCKVYALEHDWEWYSRVKQVAQALNLDAEVIYAPIKDYGDFVWYDHQNLPQPRAYGLIMIDGPPRTIGRFGVFRIFNMNNATVIMDDCEEPTLELAYHEQLKFDGLKPFIIARPECLKKSA